MSYPKIVGFIDLDRKTKSNNTKSSKTSRCWNCGRIKYTNECSYGCDDYYH